MDAYDNAPREALLHRSLLRSGGLLLTPNLADARLALARGDLPALVDSVTQSLKTTGGRLAPDDLELLVREAGSLAAGEALRATQQPAPAGFPAVDGQFDEHQYTFYPYSTETVPPDVWVPPVVDLTGERSALRAVAADEADWAATAAAASLPGAVAVWRTWRQTSQGFGRGSRSRVVLVEVDMPVADLPAHTAEVMATLAAENVEAPLVEMHPVNTPAPAYFLAARRGAALLWAAEADHPVSIARAFDGVDPVTGPFFDEDHPKLDDVEKDAVLNYLGDAPVLLSSTERMVDVFDPRGGPQVSTDHRTDGFWTWTESVPYYLRTHGLAPDPEFLTYLRGNNYVLPEVTPVGRHRAIAALYLPADEMPVWAV